MKKIVSSLIILMIFCTQSFSRYTGLTDNEIRAHARLLNVYSEAILDRTKIGLLSLATLIRRTNLTPKEAHDLFGEVASELDGIRAIIFINAAGELKYDSFSYPTPKVNLAERQYFINAEKSSAGKMILGKQIKGKTSNIPFLPIAMKVEQEGQFIGVLTAIVTPSILVMSDNPSNCLHCVALLTDLEGNVIADHPAGLELSEDFKSKLHAASQPAKGTEIIEIGQLKARIYWIRNSEFPYISVFLEFIRN